MGTATSPLPVKLITALLGRDTEIMAVARRLLTDRFGSVDTESEAYPFTFTDYYDKEMGNSLIKQFISFSHLIDPEALADAKSFTNEIEQDLAQTGEQPGRAVNIDPGYITGAKLVLATTKDYSHRVYLCRGVYAETTLQFRYESFHPYPWTYPDYKTELALAYFTRVRRIYLEQG